MSSKISQNLLGEYSDQISLSLVASTLVYNFYLIFKIRYGSELITKITLKPYYYALVYLSLGLIKALLRSYFNNNTTDPKHDLNIWNNADSNRLIAVIRVLDGLGIIVFFNFITSRIHMIVLLYHFMLY